MARKRRWPTLDQVEQHLSQAHGGHPVRNLARRNLDPLLACRQLLLAQATASV